MELVLTMMKDKPSVMQVFDTLHRFHVYDHNEEEWVMSGVEFEECCVVKHKYGEKPERYRNLDILVEGQDHLTLVYEDGETDDERLEEVAIDDDASGMIGETAQSAVAERIGEDPENVLVAEITAPNVVTFKRA